MAQGLPPAPVVVAQAVQQELAPVAWFPGQVISRNDARLAAEVQGRVVWVAEVGDVIDQGEPVARLDDTLLKETLIENESAVAREQARLSLYVKEVRRLSSLVKQNNAARNSLDEAISNRAVSRSEIAAARARVMQVRERLARARILAPFTGVVTQRLVQLGEWADSGDAVVRLVDSKTLEVQTQVPATNLAYVTPGQSLRLKGNPKEDTAEVRAIVPVGDDRSRLFELRLITDQAIWSAGELLRVAVPTDTAREVITVPRDALVLRREGTIVYRIKDDDTAEPVAVATGIADGLVIAVSGSLQPGDRVVVRGGERLRPGQQVKIIPANGTQ
ncbi:MAG: efflux RND transporter periplasmic adaptor subunit [Gammaproteobacteria bacterium]